MQLIANINDPTVSCLQGLVVGNVHAGPCTTRLPTAWLIFANPLNGKVNPFQHFTGLDHAGRAGGPGGSHASGCLSHPDVEDRRWNTRTKTIAQKTKGSAARRSILMAQFCVSQLHVSAPGSELSAICRSCFPPPQMRSDFSVHSFLTRSVPSCVVMTEGGEQ